MAVGVGFEPTELFKLNNFQDCRFRPLSHPTAQYSTRKRVACQRKVLLVPHGAPVLKSGVQCGVMPRAIPGSSRACSPTFLRPATDSHASAAPWTIPRHKPESWVRLSRNLEQISVREYLSNIDIGVRGAANRPGSIGFGTQNEP